MKKCIMVNYESCVLQNEPILKPHFHPTSVKLFHVLVVHVMQWPEVCKTFPIEETFCSLTFTTWFSFVEQCWVTSKEKFLHVHVMHFI